MKNRLASQRKISAVAVRQRSNGTLLVDSVILIVYLIPDRYINTFPN